MGNQDPLEGHIGLWPAFRHHPQANFLTQATHFCMQREEDPSQGKDNVSKIMGSLVIVGIGGGASVPMLAGGCCRWKQALI